MRALSLAGLVVALTLSLGGSAHAQGKDKDKDKDKKPEWPTEIGGKKVDEWIKEIAQKDRAKSLQALKTVVAFGPEKSIKAVPVIVAELKKHKPALKQYLDTSFLANAPSILMDILAGHDDIETKQLDDIVDAFKTLLKDDQVVVKYRTLIQLGRLGTHWQGAHKEVVALLRDPHTWEIRYAAAALLGHYAFDHKMEKLAEDVKDVSEGLLKRLKFETSSQVKLAILNSIDQLDLPRLETTKKAVDQYVAEIMPAKGSSFSEEKDPIVRITAHVLVYGIDKTRNASRRDSLINYATKPKDQATRITALQGLARLGPEVKDKA
jgi:hypothetical protein